MGKVVLFTGGSRSGKSVCAEAYVAALDRSVVYVATAVTADDEMRERVARHRARRPAEWQTLEAEVRVAARLGSVANGSAVLLDALSMLASNVLLGEEDDPELVLRDEVAALLQATYERDLTLVVVTDEVGMGIVPAYPLGRRYRDLLGQANQQVAVAASEVYLVIDGIAVDLRRLEAVFAQRPV
jgi:adenosylcobinamide kinase/adenosylcobinamide-phosphate guanylyltransferase